MERKLGIEIHCLPGNEPTKTLEMIADVGFQCFFSAFPDAKTVYDLRAKADTLGLSYDFIHAPFGGINNLWLSGLDYLSLYEKIKGAMDAAAAWDIPTVVCHVSSGWWPPQLSDIGLSRFDGLVEHAIKKNVKIAFENIRKPGNLAAIMERYEKIPQVGFCFDNGHEHCYTETIKYLDLYHDRVLCTHIHDNLGRDKEDIWKDADYHMVPFDGTYDFADMMARLNKYGYQGSLMLELTKGKTYEHLTGEEYLRMVYDRLVKISKM